MVIDVYSALTLDRSYRKAFSAPKALMILLSEQEDYDQKMLYHFIDTLNIYPPKTTVQLNDGSEAEVVEMLESLPTICKVNVNGKAFMLPSDKSVYIERIISWRERKEERYQKVWRKFIHSLLHEEDQKVLEYISELEDGYKIEDVFIQLFEKAMNEMEQKDRQQQIKRSELLIALPKLRRVMGIKSNEYANAIITEQEPVLFVTVGKKGDIRNHILADLLVSTGYKLEFMEVDNLKSDLPLEDFLQYIS
nr:hypothetical protein [Halobacillus salinus]